MAKLDHETGRPTGAAIGIFLNLPGYELFLGEAELVHKDVVGGLGESPAIVLKFSGDVRPDPSGLTGWERVIPLQPLSELPNKDEGQCPGDLAVCGEVSHCVSPEITPGMEAAGVAVLRESGYLDHADLGFELLPRQVFSAMWRSHLAELAERK